MSANATAMGPSTGWQVERPGGRCAGCGRSIPPGETYVGALRETPAGFERLDVGAECWDELEKSNLIGDWRTVMPSPNDKPKRFVDDGLLLEMFHRLENAEEPARLNFRFVLGLLLMRKRLLTYQSSRHDAGREVWAVRVKGSDEPADLVNPDLNDEQVADVTRQLGDVLNEDVGSAA